MDTSDPLLTALPTVRERFVRHDLGHVVRVVRLLDENPAYYAEQTVARYWDEHPQLGSSDRALVGGLVYALVRWRRRVEDLLRRLPPPHLGGDHYSNSVLLACGALLRLAGYARETVAGAVHQHTSPNETADWLPSWLDRAHDALRALDPAGANTSADLALRTSFPDWIIERWQTEYGWERAKAMAIASRSRASLAARTNILLTTRDEVISTLGGSGIAARATRFSPWGVETAGPVQLRQSALYRAGKIEFQDEGSQLVALLTGARPGMVVVDACAGGGGKTLALAAMMANRGNLLALDTASQKLQELRKRARRSGVTVVRTAHAHDVSAYASWIGGADRVLVDAPCSGSGTWRRVPDGPAHLTAESLAQLAAAQRSLLGRYARLVRPGGRLIYATCSLFREENEAVIGAWLVEHPEFHLVRADTALPDAIATHITEGPYLALTPERHGTDGFFAAIVERAGD